jgi:inhibitor of cysteine peptidase
MATILLTGADSGKMLEAHVGDTLVVRLDENPATGYRWTMEKHDEVVMETQSIVYAPVHGTGVGGGGQRVLTFKARKAGRVILRLERRRAWEGDTAAAEQFVIAVNVEP